MEIGVIKYSIADSAIAKMSKKYMHLTIDGIKDKKGFDLVHAARMVVKGQRVKVEKKRKELKADALKYGKAVDNEANRIKGLLEPIETHLQNEEDRIQAEKDEIKAEKARKEQERQEKIRENIALLNGYLAACVNQSSQGIQKISDRLEAFVITEDDFGELKDEAIETADRIYAEIQDMLIGAQKREKAEAEQKAEAERLERQRKEQEAERKKIEDEKRKIQEEKDRIAREEREKKIAEEAAERAKQEEKERLERAEKDRIAKEKADKEEKVRQERLKPDRDKIYDLVHALEDLTIPKVKSDIAREVLVWASNEIKELADLIRIKGDDL